MNMFKNENALYSYQFMELNKINSSYTMNRSIELSNFQIRICMFSKSSKSSKFEKKELKIIFL